VNSVWQGGESLKTETLVALFNSYLNYILLNTSYVIRIVHHSAIKASQKDIILNIIINNNEASFKFCLPEKKD